MLHFLTNGALVSANPAEVAQLAFNPIEFINNLQYMGIGMLVIFIIIGIIILSTKLINYLFSDTSDK